MKKKNNFITLSHEGSLTDLGYDVYASEDDKRRALKRAIKAYGHLAVIRRLNAVSVLNKNREPALSKKFARDRDWVSAKYKEYKTKNI
jgi:hypothetical protein